MPLTLSLHGALAAQVGDAHGLTEADLNDLAARMPGVLGAIGKRRQAGEIGFLDLPFRSEGLDDILAFAESARSRFDTVVLLGIGGSALGPLTLFQACCGETYNLLPTERRGGPRFFVVDNVDPQMLADVLAVTELKKTLFLAISKSGGTPETVAALRYVIAALREAVGDKWAEHVALVTDPEKGAFRRLAREQGVRAFAVPPNVGGRFSVLSAVGLLPAVLLGLNVEELLHGAREAATLGIQGDFAANWPYRLGAIHWSLATRKGKGIAVCMPYAQSLKLLSDWFTQLWAESLGKAQLLDGTPAATGQTCVKALGATDQHSQVQLFLEGPNDKILTLIGVRESPEDLPIPAWPLPDSGSEYLDGHTFHEVLQAELAGTLGALQQRQRPALRLDVDRVDEATIGNLFMGYEIATAVAGELYSIHTYDQPGVELGKVITRKRLAGGV